MPFRTYQITPVPDSADTYLLSGPGPFRLSGPDGLLAAHTRTLTAESGARAWAFDGAGLLALAGLPAAPPRWVVFEQSTRDSSVPVLSRVLQIRGLSGVQTELLVSFGPLEILKPNENGLRVRVPAGARQWHEELALNGGILNLKGPWTWSDRALNIGATVVG